MKNIDSGQVVREYTIECIKSIPEHSLKSKRLECINAVIAYCNSLNDDIETKDIEQEYVNMLKYFCYFRKD